LELSRDGHSPLHLAILNYHFDVANFLLRTGANIHEANERMVGGKTLLHHGIESLPRGIEIVAFLLARGARQLPDVHGTMPIHGACCRRNLELIAMLADHDAEINIADRKLMTPLHHAVRHNSPQVCVMLLENDADLAAVDRRGRTPLHHAAALGFLPLVELLCDYGANVFDVDWDEKTPMNLAYAHNRRNVVAYFASLGVDNQDEEEVDRRVQPRMSIRGEFPERKIYSRF
jgi:ankyrin